MLTIVLFESSVPVNHDSEQPACTILLQMPQSFSFVCFQGLPTTWSNSALLICVSLMLTVSSCLTSPNRKPSCANKFKNKTVVRAG